MLAPSAGHGPVILIIPGSGPTDRNGNSPIGVGAAYRLLAEGLVERGVSTVRVDKRGMFGSAGAVAEANAVTIADYVADVHAWTTVIRQQTKAACVWLLGHSEGGLVALAAGKNQKDLCGLILVATPGRPMGEVIRDQLKANPANARLLAEALPAIDALDAGKHRLLQCGCAHRPFHLDTRAVGGIAVSEIIVAARGPRDSGIPGSREKIRGCAAQVFTVGDARSYAEVRNRRQTIRSI